MVAGLAAVRELFRIIVRSLSSHVAIFFNP